MIRGVQALQISRDGVVGSGTVSATSSRQSVLASPTTASPLSSVDRSVDSGSDDDDESEEDAMDDGGGDDEDEADDGVMDDVDQVDASGRVLNDGDELLDEPVRTFEEKTQQSGKRGLHSASSLVSHSSAYSIASSPGELVAGAGASHNADGTRRIWLCPSKYGRPATVYFDYPLAFDMSRPQEKVLCEKPCTLRFKHADSACIYNSVTGTLKRAGFVEQTGTNKKEASQWNVRWGKHMLPESFKELRSYHKVNHFPGTGGIGRKDRLARNIAKSRRRFGAGEYNFLPETYLLPADRSLWEMKFAAEPPGTLWICRSRDIE